MDGVIVWRFLFCGIFCWIKREFTSFKVWSWSALPRLAQETPSASTNVLWLVIFGTLRKIFTCNTFLLQNPMARHRQRCLRHTMDFGVQSFSISGSLYSLIWFLLDPFYRRGRVYKRKFCLSVCVSVITVSFFEYSIIRCFIPCTPYIFWKLIMLATSTALFWSSTTEYQPVPPTADPVFNDLMV